MRTAIAAAKACNADVLGHITVASLADCGIPLLSYPGSRARVLHDGPPQHGFESAMEAVPGSYRPDPRFCILDRKDVAGPHDVLGHGAPLVSAIADEAFP